ncbi:MAG: Fic family protein [Bacteriovorax sp.]
MRRNELSEQLRQDYTDSSLGGVQKLDLPGWENIPFVVPPPPPRKIRDKLPFGLLSEAIKTLNALPRYNEMSEIDKLINYLFVRREVVQSSRLEGTWSTIDHVLTPGELNDRGEGKDAHQAVRSYARLLEGLIEQAFIQKEKIYSEKLICKIHKEIVEKDPNSNGVPGKLRTPGEIGSVVTIGGLNRKEESIYNPAPPNEVKRCLHDVLKWLGDDKLSQQGDAGVGLTLPIRLAVGHSHFEAVHPFTDGNGRTGRALWPLQMVTSGYMPLYLSGYVEIKKEEYARALEKAQKKLNYVPLIEFICHAILESALEVKKSKAAIESLETIWQERGHFKDKSAAKRALKILLHYPIISSSILKEKLQISAPASTNAINQLIEKKIIRHRHFENRKPIYAAEELIHILSRPFGTDIDLALEKARLLLKGDHPSKLI